MELEFILIVVTRHFGYASGGPGVSGFVSTSVTCRYCGKSFSGGSRTLTYSTVNTVSEYGDPAGRGSWTNNERVSTDHRCEGNAGISLIPSYLIANFVGGGGGSYLAGESGYYGKSDWDDTVYPVNDREGFDASPSILLGESLNENRTGYMKIERLDHSITYELSGGSFFEDVCYSLFEGQSYIIPRPIRPDFRFDGWTLQGNGSLVESTFTMGTTDVVLVAKWKPIKSIYKVKHWDQNLNGDEDSYDQYNYTQREIQTREGEIDSKVKPPTMYRKGFESPPLQEITITEDGKAEVNYYYKRKSYDLDLQAGTGIKKVTGTGSYLYEQEVTISAEVADSTAEHSYTWDKWTKKTDDGEVDFATKQSGYKFTMPAEDVTLKANATESTNSYKQIIQKRYEKADGTFTDWEDVINEDKEYGAEVSWSVAAEGDYQAASIETYTVKGDKTTQVTIYRKKFNVTVNKNTGISSTTNTGEYRVGQTVTVTATPATGYSWKNWTSTDVTSSNNQTYEFTMPRKAVIITANATIKTYNIAYNLEGGTNATGNPTNYTVETETITLRDPTRTGYTFTGWTGSNGNTPQKAVKINKGSTGEKEYTANWEANEVGYRVRHWIQKLDGIAEIKTDKHYKLEVDESKTGLTDSKVIPEVKTFTGFTAPPEEERREVTIAGFLV